MLDSLNLSQISLERWIILGFSRVRFRFSVDLLADVYMNVYLKTFLSGNENIFKEFFSYLKNLFFNFDIILYFSEMLEPFSWNIMKVKSVYLLYFLFQFL